MKLDFSSKKDSVKDLKLSNTEIKNLIIEKSNKLFTNKKFLKTIKDSLLSLKEKDKIIGDFIMSKSLSLYTNFKEDKKFKNDSLEDFQVFKNLFIANLENKIATNNINYKVNELLKEGSKDQLLKTTLGETFFTKMTSFKNCKTKNVSKALDSLGYKRTRKNIFLFKKAKELKAISENEDSKKAYINSVVSKISIVLFLYVANFRFVSKTILYTKKV